MDVLTIPLLCPVLWQICSKDTWWIVVAELYLISLQTVPSTPNHMFFNDLLVTSPHVYVLTISIHVYWVRIFSNFRKIVYNDLVAITPEQYFKQITKRVAEIKAVSVSVVMEEFCDRRPNDQRKQHLRECQILNSTVSTVILYRVQTSVVLLCKCSKVDTDSCLAPSVEVCTKFFIITFGKCDVFVKRDNRVYL